MTARHPARRSSVTPTAGQMLAYAKTTLASVSETAALDSRVLLAEACGLTPTELAANPDLSLNQRQREDFSVALSRRQRGEPIAHIVGHKEFWSLDLMVTPDTLIPRPETELLVERALLRIPNEVSLTTVDLGTGCGAVALAIAKERPRCRVIATDASPRALEVARANADALGIHNVEFRQGDWYAPIKDEYPQVIATNPPYIGAQDPHLDQGDVCFEPRMALVGGRDGMSCVRHIISQARRVLAQGAWLILEHGFDQHESVAALMGAEGFLASQCYRDYSNHPRVSECRII